MALAAVHTNNSLESVQGILGQLDDEDDNIVQQTLITLIQLIPHHWAEIANDLTKIEKLSEDDSFNYKKLASLLVSKVFFHLQTYEDSLNFALAAEELFDITEQSQYVKKLTEQCIDSYRIYMQNQYKLSKEEDVITNIDNDNNNDDNNNQPNNDNNNNLIEKKSMDPRLIDIVERVFQHCYDIHDYKHAIGIAVECRRLDHIEKSVQYSNDRIELLQHIFNLCETVIDSKYFRNEVLKLIIDLYNNETIINPINKNYNHICRCYFYLNLTKPISDILWLLINNNNNNNQNNDNQNNDNNNNNNNHKNELIAYQIAFDLTEYQNDTFLRSIFNNIPQPPIIQPENQEQKQQTIDNPNNNNINNNNNQPSNNDNNNQNQNQQNIDKEMQDLYDDTEDIDMQNNDNQNQNQNQNQKQNTTNTKDFNIIWNEELKLNYKRLSQILLGEIIIPLSLDFLFRNSNSDLLILKKLKDGISERNSVLNNSLICCNGIMHCGTTIDQFLRDNLEWMGRAAHWAKFTATASLGMIHYNHITASMNILQRYLPGSGGGPYQEGGALYALGLIHCGDNSNITVNDTRDYLLKNLKQASNEILQHGCCLGIGLSSLGFGKELNQSIVTQIINTAQVNNQTNNNNNNNNNGPLVEDILKAIRDILFADRAVPGESAGLALGLILCGSGNKEWYKEMLAYAHETQHEKIIRGLSMGIAIMHYNLEEKANTVINELILDKDETIRYGGCYTIGLSYAATGNTTAISKLLHLAVSDVSDDVRRAAVTNIGFILLNKPNQLPKVIKLLSNSYNSHVRYGAAAALGIACAGTGNKSALKILKSLCNDNKDYVRQASLISIGMLLMEQNKNELIDIEEIREKYFLKLILDKREPTMCVLGAILGYGLIDASGRNVTISLYNKYNNCKQQKAIIGMSIFWQYWYWYPLIPFITLCFKPTMILCLNYELNMPKILIKSNANKSKYDYVEMLKEEKLDNNKKLIKVELSQSKKDRQRKLKRQLSLQKKTDEINNNNNQQQTSQPKKDDAVDAMDVDKPEKDDKDKNNDNKDNKDIINAVENDKMDVDKDENNKDNKDKDDKDNKDKDKETSKDGEKDEKKENDSNNNNNNKEEKKDLPYTMLENPSRVTPNQSNCIRWIDKRYKPISNRLFGFVMVEDTKPEEKVELVQQKALNQSGVYGNEPDPPKPFIYLGD